MQNVPFVGIDDGHYPAAALPIQTYSASLTLRQGSEDLTLINYGPAHTDGDTIIYVTPANMVVVGDIVSSPFYPVIDLASGSSIDGLIHSTDAVLERTNEQTKIVPGHGPLATQADLQAYRDMLAQVRQRVQALVASGKTMDQAVVETPTGSFDVKWGNGYVTGKLFTEMVYTSVTNTGQSQ